MQENTLLRLFDADTGHELEDSVIVRSEAEKERILEQGRQMEALTKMPGWKIINEFCLSQIEGRKEKLVDARDMDEIRRQQSFISAFSLFLGAVASVIHEASELEAEIKKQEREAAEGRNA